MRHFLIHSTIRLSLAILLLGLCSCSQRKVQTLLEPSVALGSVLADDAIHAAGTKKQIAIISADASWGPASTAEEAFKAALKAKGFTTVIAKSANLGDPMRMSSVGLMAPDFAEALEKSRDAGAIVSFVGGPQFWQSQMSLNSPHPPVFVVATAMLGNVPGVPTDHNQLQAMLNAGLIQVAIIDGSEPQNSGKTDAAHELFAQNFRKLSKNN